ncbi:32270_t:CDS:2 [Gigaspora margarita]|uniref:Phosphatidylglycerol/phosphatidylinositol transfer protein n=1 Tax=Gigaspora margarita TaxID=4874 RepID=A0ABN7UQH9_GIGMA|nr:32270_t:CDS:2 [Gigaspora margarita]
MVGSLQDIKRSLIVKMLPEILYQKRNNEIRSVCPNPVVVGQKVTYYVTEVNTATIQQGATLNVTGSYQQHVVFNEVTDFCKEWIEVNGYKCPLEPGTYNLVVSELIHPGPNDPKNATIEYDLRVEVANPGDPKTILSCLEGKYSIYAP